MKRYNIESIIEAKEVISELLNLMSSTESRKRFELYHDRVVEEVEKLYQFIDQVRFSAIGYIVVDDCTTHNAKYFTSEVYKTLEEAEREALNAWDQLSLHDKKDRDEFYVAQVGTDDNIIDIPYRIK